MPESFGLVGFLKRVETRLDEAIEAGHFDVRQKELLLASAAQYRPRTQRQPLSDPLAVFYLVARSHRDELDEQAVELATFCQFYLLALDLLDDVQDDDLSGKPHDRVGAAMAVNDGLTLLFLGLSSLERCMRLEQSAQRRMQYLKLVNRVALTTSRGQHLDLLGASGARTPHDVLQMQREKTASLALICECAALYAGVGAQQLQHYRALGEDLSVLVQVLDDVRDVYGKSRSPDLEHGKLSYPVSCFLEHASPVERERLAQLTRSLPESLREIRSLLYQTGTLREVARTIDRFRRSIHRHIAALDQQAATHRLLLSVIDQMVEALYTPALVPETASLFEPSHGFHGHVRRLAHEFACRLAPLGAPKTPRLVPWHLPQWMYDKRRGAIFYPDIDGLPEETLPFQACLLGETDLRLVARLVWHQAPALVAHELFHHYRDALGLLSSDMWHEELVANTLAVAYTARYEPQVVTGGLDISERVLARPESRLSADAQRVLRELLEGERSANPGSGYGMDLQQNALVQLAMIRELSKQPADLVAACRRWLSAGYANAS